MRWNRVPCCRAENSSKGDRYPTCLCSFCSRSRRRHWELFGIPDMTKKKNQGLVPKRWHNEWRG